MRTCQAIALLSALMLGCTEYQFKPAEDVSGALGPLMEVSPRALDFGTHELGETAVMSFTVASVGDEDLEVDPLLLTDTYGHFALLAGEEAAVLPPGERVDVEVAFSALSTSTSVAEVTVTSNAWADPEAIVSLVGAAVDDSTWNEKFSVPEAEGVDIVFFGDTSGSMAVELTTFGAEALSFIEEIETDNWQIITVTGPDGCATEGIITPETPDYLEVLARGLMVVPGEDEVDEWGLHNLWMAIENTGEGQCNEGFLREESMLHAIVISDEDDNSPGWDSGDGDYWMPYVEPVLATKTSTSMVKYSAIAGDLPSGCEGAEPGIGYYEAVGATGGEWLSICGEWWLGLGTLGSVSMAQDTFLLDEIPLEETLKVAVNFEERLSGWTYDAEFNVVVFTTDVPVSGDIVEIGYEVLESE